jgi:hypothetical protein
MGGILAPMVVVFMSLALWGVYKNDTRLITPPTYTLQMNSDATTFLAYRNAVTSYMHSNPGFRGTVPAASISGQFPAVFFATTGGAASNYVSSTGGSGYVISCWAKLSTGTVYQAVTQAGGDASIGTSNGSTWVSAAPGVVTTPVALTTPVPAGDIVSVIQIGS